MSDAFVPFLPGAAVNGRSKTEFQQLKPDGANVAQPAAGMEPAGGAMPSLQVNQAVPAVHEHGTPQVTVQREGERVTGIRVQCGCGQVLTLDCVY